MKLSQGEGDSAKANGRGRGEKKKKPALVRRKGAGKDAIHSEFSGRGVSVRGGGDTDRKGESKRLFGEPRNKGVS